MTTLTLFSPVIPLLLLLSLSCQRSESAGSHATLKAVSDSAAHGVPPPSPLTASPIVNRFTDADFKSHVNELNSRLRKKLSARRTHGFSIVVQRPFVVIGDEPPAMVKRHAEETVKWAVDRLKQ